MNDDLTELERELARIPMPTVSPGLDQKVLQSIRDSRVQNLSSQTNHRFTPSGPQLETSRYWSLHVAAVSLLCIISFVAGRFSIQAPDVTARPIAESSLRNSQPTYELVAEPALRNLLLRGESKESVLGLMSSAGSMQGSLEVDSTNN